MVKRQIISASDSQAIRQLKEWCNTVADEFRRGSVKGDGATTRVTNGVVSAFKSSFPGKVYVNFLAFYDPDMFTDPLEQIGTAIVDNSTDEAKTYIKITLNGTLDTDVVVSYEDAPDPLVSPWPEKTAWFLVSEWSIPITWLPPTGAETAGQVRQYQGDGVYKWVTVDTVGLPVGGTGGQSLVKISDNDQDAGWDHVLPTPGKGHVVMCTTDSPAANDPSRGFGTLAPDTTGAMIYTTENGVRGNLAPPLTDKAMLTFSTIPNWTTLSNTKPALLISDPASSAPLEPLEFSNAAPLLLVIYPTGAIEALPVSTSADPSMLVWQAELSEFQFIEFTENYEVIYRDSDNMIKVDELRATV